VTVEPDRSVRRLLAALGTAMIATGQPIDEIEDELRAIGRHFGYPDLQVGAGPTGIYLGLASGEPATFASVTGGLRLDQAADVRLIRHLVATDQLGVEPAIQRLRDLPGKPPRYPCSLIAVSATSRPWNSLSGKAVVVKTALPCLASFPRSLSKMGASTQTVSSATISMMASPGATCSPADLFTRTIVPEMGARTSYSESETEVADVAACKARSCARMASSCAALAVLSSSSASRALAE